ncbi:MAG: hypothetical protein JWM85_3218 [Acidimicrobiaceae bacterium]|nr:hypothetical protein [Acidimicrobiaceae bacterium]
MAYWTNSEVLEAVNQEIEAHTAAWVLEEQPIGWDEVRWRKSWSKYEMPADAPILDALALELVQYGLIRRSFVFAHAHEDPTDLVTAVMAWGSGDEDNRGAWRAAEAIGGPVDDVFADVTAALGQGQGAITEAFRALFHNGQARLPRCNVSYGTKVLHFFAYQGQVRPRPLIYDLRVANALARMPSAPYVPHQGSVIRGDQYERYCSWAEAYAEDKKTEPIVVEYALFAVGGRLT